MTSNQTNALSNLKAATNLQPIFSVLELKASINQNDLSKLKEIEADYYNSLPLVDKGKIDKLKRDLQMFPVDKQLSHFPDEYRIGMLSSLEEILKINENQKQLQKPMAVFVFFNIISYLYFREQEQITVRALTQIIKCLIKCVNQYQGLSTVFFQNLINVNIEVQKNEFDKEFFHAAFNFIKVNHTIDGTFYPSFTKLCEYSFLLNIDELTSEVLDLILLLFTEKRSFIKKDDQSLLLACLKPFIEQFDPKIFLILSAISQVSKCQALKDIYSNFCNSIVNQYSNFPIKIGEQKESDKLPAVEITNRDNYAFVGTEFHTFPKGFRSLPPQFFEKYDISQHFPQELWNLTSKIQILLKKSNQEVSETFFARLIELIREDKESDIFYTNLVVLLQLLQDNSAPNLLGTFKDLLISNRVFNYTHVIFNEGGLDPVINYLRNQIVKLLFDKDTQILMEIMNIKSSLLFVELLGRLLCNSCKLNNLANYKSFFTDLIDISTYLQNVDFQYHSEKMTILRSVIFLFISEMAKYPIFLIPEFVKNFVSFVFEVDITNQILFIFKLNFSLCQSVNNKYLPITEKFSTILHICVSRSVTNERYWVLSYKIAEMISLSLKHCNQIIELAYQLFDVIYQCFKAKPTKEYLLVLLSILGRISSWKENYALKVEMITFISKFIKDNELFEKPYYIRFLCLLSNRNSLSQRDSGFNQFYFIERPQFILFFLAAFGASPPFCYYLRYLSLNCQFSPYTARNCHDGCLDIVLLQFLSKGKEECQVEHRGIQIDLKIPIKQQRKYVFPLLISMLSAKTSYSVVYLLHKLCSMKNVDFLTVFESALANCSSRHSPYYLISSLPINSHCNNFSINQTQFSFTFWYKMDVERIIKTNPEIIFFSITNPDNKTNLTLKYAQNKIILVYKDSSDKVTQSPFIFFLTDKSVDFKENVKVANKWHFFGLTLFAKENRQEGFLYLDHILLGQLKMPLMNFGKGKLELKLGTVKTNDPQRCRELGYIAEFCYMPKYLNANEFHEYFLQKPRTEQELVEIESKSSCFHSKTLLDIYDDDFVLSQFINALNIVLKQDFLYSLKYILSSLTQQLNFSMTDDVLDCVLKIEPRNSSLYLTVYSIFEVISDVKLEEEWISTLIFNPDLWLKCDHVSKYTILCHWNSTLLQNYVQIFKSTPRFSLMLVSFESAFNDDEDDCKFEYTKLLSKLAFLNFSPEDSNKLITIAFSLYEKPSFKYYLMLIRNISVILSADSRNKIITCIHSILLKSNFNNDDLSTLHGYLMTLHDLASLSNNAFESIILLRLLPNVKVNIELVYNDILNNINDFPGFYPLLCGLSSFIKKGDDDENVLKEREKLAKEILHMQKSLFPSPQFQPSFHPPPASKYSQKNISTPDMKNPTSPANAPPNSQRPQTKAQAKAAVKVAASPVSKQQNQSLAASISPSGSRTSMRTSAVEIEDKEYKLKMMYGEFWYLFPIILSFEMSKTPNGQFLVFDFLANGTQVLGSQSEKVATIQNIVSLLTYISAGLNVLNLASKYLISLHDLIPPNETQVLTEIVNQLVYISFYHISPHTHNAAFRKEFKNSPFYNTRSVPNYTISSIFPSIKLNSISDVDDFIGDRKSPSIGIEHIFDEKDNFVSFPTFQIAMKVLNETKIKSDYTDIINYFAKKKCDGSCNFYRNPNLFDKMRSHYTEQFASVTTRLFLNMSKMLKETKNAVSFVSSIELDHFDKEARSLFVPLKDLQPRPQLTNMLDFCRSRKLTPSCPTKIKKRLFTRPKKKINRYQNKKAECSCLNSTLINIRKTTHCDLFAGKDGVRISTDHADKLYKINDISIVFIYDTSIEIHTNRGQSYLIDIGQPTTLLSKQFPDYMIAKLSFSKWTSNFEYLIYLNNLSGRSFSKPKSYPIFPNVLVNFTDYMCRNVASVKPNSNDVQPPDLNFLRWAGSLYSLSDFSIRTIIENDSFLPPEFYYFTELFSDCKLPPWASTKFEFVYKMRKLLESDSVTKNLPKWIDMIWCDKEYTSTKFGHKVIFHIPHPSKESCVPSYSSSAAKVVDHEVELLKGPTVVFSFLYQKTFGLISSDRQIQFYSIVDDKEKFVFKKLKGYTLDDDVSKYVFFSTNELANAFNKDSMNLTSYNSKNIVCEKTIYCEVPVFSEFGRSFVYSEDLSTIRTGSSNTIRSENDIICFAANDRLGIVVYATVDNVVHMKNIAKAMSDIPRKLTGIPLRLMITQSWGFVVVQTPGEITVLNQNCELIKTVKFEYDMNYWTTFSSAKGFDYILFKYRINALCMFEAMYPEHVSYVCEANDMVSAHFNPSKETLLITNKFGKVTVKQISLSSMFK